MKQKRKVKSLLPYKINKDGTMLTVLLLILSLVLCLGSASLMTVSVGAADTKMNNYDMVYPGIDDNTEVLYGLQFSDRNRLWDELVNQFFMKNKTLYISPNQVKVKSKDSSFVDNTIDTGKYINVLGGEDNNVKSDNITIIAGNGNKIETSNDNAAILGGQGNRVEGVSSGAPAVIAGGDSNIIEGNNSNVIIGGKNNIIKNAESAVILGGEKNTVNGGENIIVGGSNVEVNGVDNVFVYSNSSSKFNPKSPNAFYLNLNDGVGINADAVKGGLSVSGAVGFGEIDINRKTCNDNNIGVIGNWQGCLVGCTEASKHGGKWELLDRGSICEDRCAKEDQCMYSPNTTPRSVDDYMAFCTGNVSTKYADRCTTGENQSYGNVVFETVIIDVDEECPVSGHNKCVFRCNPGTTLTGGQCYKNCTLPWDPDTKVAHGYFTDGYNKADVVCANDNDKSPVDTCAKHKKVIECNDGVWKIQGTDTDALPEYSLKSCMLGGYRCKTGTNFYNLTTTDIEGRMKDISPSNSRVVKDRTNVNGKRGQYKICIDYDPFPRQYPNRTLNGDTCSTGDVSPQPYHYKFIKCQNGYHTGVTHPDVCMQDCILTGLNGVATSYRHTTTITGYMATGATCTGVCVSAKLVCNDGKWRLGNISGDVTTTYPYNDCKLSDKVCTGYTLNQSIYNQHKSNSKYDACVPYSGNGKFTCNKQVTGYKLIDCVSDNHTEPGDESWMKWCISNEKTVNCLTGNGDPQKYEYFITGVKVTWSGSRNSGSWSTPKACEWKCKEGYHLSGEYNNGGECVSNKKNVPCKTGWAEGHWNYKQVDVEIIWTGGWNTGHWSEPKNCELSGCAPGWCPVGTCGSQTEEVLCTSNPNMPTTGAHEINTGELYTVSCGEKRYCDWVCDTGRHLEDGLCVPNIRQCEEVGELMEGAYFDHTNKFTYWQGEWNTGYWVTEPCDILCTGGYYPQPVSGNCEKLPGCYGNLSGSKFNFAVVVSSGTDDMVESVDRTIYPDLEAASGHACSLVCDENHVLVEGVCKKCFKESDNFDQEKMICVNDVVCPENYSSLCEKNASGKYECSCEFLGKCLNHYYLELSVPTSSGVILLDNSYNYNRPYWKNLSESQQNQEGLQWKCAKKMDELEPHSCTYTCGAGYHCYGYPSQDSRLRCEKDSDSLECNTKNFFGYAYSPYNPTPVDGKTDWEMYYEESVDYGSFDTGLNLDGCYSMNGWCYTSSLREKGCAWACQSSTKLAKLVTKYSYERNDHTEWHCWKKCPADQIYTDNGCESCKKQYEPDTSLLLGPDENGYGIEGTGNAVACKRKCPIYWNYNSDKGICEKVVCDADDGKYMYKNEMNDGSYGCNTCQLNDGFYLTGRNEEAGAYTECEYRCEQYVQEWDEDLEECKYINCNEYYSDPIYYFHPTMRGGASYRPACYQCGKQQVVDISTWSDYYNNYMSCRKRCGDDELYFDGKCIPISVGIKCDEGEMPEVDGDGNVRCISCLEGGKTWDSDQGKCV